MLNEVHGYLKDVDEIFEPLRRRISNVDIDTLLPNDGDVKRIRFRFKAMIQQIPVKLYVNLKLTRTSVRKRCSASVNSGESFVAPEGSRFAIDFDLRGDSVEDYSAQCYYTLSHEIIHVLESYMRVAKNGWDERKHGMGWRGVKSHYYTCIENMKVHPENKLFAFLYLTEKREIHAVVGELRGALKLYNGNLSTSQDIAKAIKRTKAYNRLNAAIRIYNMYVNGIGLDGKPLSDEEASKLRLQGILTWNYIMAPSNKGSRKRDENGDKGVFTDNQFRKKTKARLDDFENLFWKQAYKIGYDVAQERIGNNV